MAEKFSFAYEETKIGCHLLTEWKYGRLQVRKSGFGRRGRSSNKGGRPDITMNDAFCYLKRIKDMFWNRREKYHMFLVLMNDLRKKRIDMVGFIAKIEGLFKGYPTLLLGLNPFLPKGYKITLSNEDKRNFERAVSLMTKIKACLAHEYKYFLDVLFTCEKEHKDVKELYRKAAVLLKDHPDLLDELAKFLSVSSTAKPLFNLDEDRISMN
ncbi:paired amphipathic helix protein Sin3-like 5 [Solanum pennellii]|uniref:Paired amphipathic helix protein Sin3-like 5 n=1 Tax=Solanum pennellii TaxID=28526 RepID=A0ABM1VF00_SOLPN|nr:paired amphipathic helix protein Sin3-like 5 [Solanum pennellii]